MNGNDFQSEENSHYSGTQALLESNVGLKNYNLSLVKRFARSFRIKKGEFKNEIVEYGAGTGTLADLFKSKFNLTPKCIEIDLSQIDILKEKGFKVFENLDSFNSIRYIYTSNVLEHIENDVLTLKQIYNKMEIGGVLAIYVPALGFLFSDQDRAVGHYRRYSKKKLINTVKESGFNVIECKYCDSLGILANLLVKVFGYNNKKGLGSQKSIIIYDRIFFPISIILDRLFFEYFLGKNLYLVAIKD